MTIKYYSTLKNNFTALAAFLLLTINAAAQTFTEILGRPTNNSITVSILFNQNVNIYVEYGTVAGVYTNSTTQISNIVNTPDEIDLTNLTPDTKYYYRTRYRSTSSGAFLSGSMHSFHTQRSSGSTFTFTLEADEHLYDKKGVKSIYQLCLNNQAQDKPDFMLSLGDIFGDDHNPFTITAAQVDSLHKDYLPYLGSICHSVPFYVCLGNHEGEFDYYYAQTPPNNLAIWGTLSRKFYYPNPYPNAFYSGNTDVEPYGIGNPENYYAWTWGDALFVVLDAYRDQCDTSVKPKSWNWSLGLPQYSWFKNTLEGSSAKYKFVFIHQLRGQGRGGVLDAPFYEWGGYEANGTNYSFTTNRPGWDKPIHQLMKDNKVNILFHGHDHLFSHEVLDSIVYQECPMPSDSTYEIGMLANADAYATDTIGGSGHLRVTVSPACVKVDFVRVYLPADTLSGLHHNGEVAFSYTIGNCVSTDINTLKSDPFIKVYPNPAKYFVKIELPEGVNHSTNILLDMIGQTVLKTNSNDIDLTHIPNGIYFLNIKTAKFEMNRKVIINR